MSETETRAGDGKPARDFHDEFSGPESTSPLLHPAPSFLERFESRVVDLCDACQRVRTKWCDPDYICKSHPGKEYNECVARFWKNARSAS